MRNVLFLFVGLLALTCAPPMARIVSEEKLHDRVFYVKERHYIGNDAIWVQDITDPRSTQIDQYMWFVAFQNDPWEDKALDDFVYGQKFPFSEERVSPIPLIPGRKYRLVIHGTKGRVYNFFEFTH